ncbi:hypothetical protein C8F01DRAFT_449659 [Mycena amicta]|nr:hypothetical protein C8F01DRAFT_449659 [Mycena amicta]
MLPLPPELYDATIDHLHDDQPTLLACSLVSKDWVPRSRTHAFASVKLDIYSHLGDEKVVLRRLFDFLSIISSPHATFNHRVAEVSLAQVWDADDDNSEVPAMQPVVSPYEVIYALDRHGIRPKSLSIDCFPNFLIPLIDIPSEFASAVQELTLTLSSSTVPLGPFLDLIASFSSITTLRLVGRLNDIIRTPAPKATTLPPSLHMLSSSNAIFLDWVISLDPIPAQITTLDLSDFGKARCSWDDINPYFRSGAAETIHTLKLPGDPGPGFDGSCADLSRFRNLRHLVISLTLSESSIASTSGIGLMLVPSFDLVETISVPISMRPSDLRSYRSEVWTKLDACFANQAIFPKLQTVTLCPAPFIKHDHPDTHELRYRVGVMARECRLACSLVQALRRDLNICHQRDILRIVDIPDVQPMKPKPRGHPKPRRAG